MLLCAWASRYLESEPEVRTVLFASGTILSYLQSAFVPIAAYPASEAPHWKIGAKLYLGFAILAMFIFIGIHFALKREGRRKSEEKAEDSDSPGQEISNAQHPRVGVQDKIHFDALT